MTKNKSNQEIEEAILIATMIQESFMGRGIDEFASINEKDFTNIEIREIYKSIKILDRESSVADEFNISSWLEKHSDHNPNGGWYSVVDEVKDVGFASDLKNIIKEVKLSSQNRQTAQILAKASQSLAGGKPWDSVIARINELAEDLPANDIDLQTAYSILPEYWERLEERSKREDGIVGLETNIPIINKNLLGLIGGQLTVLAALSGGGKSLFALSILNYIVLNGERVGFIGLEMTNEETLDRLFSMQSKIDSLHLSSGKLEGEEWGKLNLAAENNAEFLKNLFLFDDPSVTIEDFEAMASQLVKKQQVKLIIVDYLQLMRSRNNFGGNRVAEISHITRTLKLIAQKYKIHIIALSQFNRASNQRKDKEPILSDLRESGSIEQDANNVLFLHKIEGEDGTVRDKLIIAKARAGKRGYTFLQVENKYGKFKEINYEDPTEF
jgi:replicative DNA helicase